MAKNCEVCGKKLGLFNKTILKGDKSLCCSDCYGKYLKGGGTEFDATVKSVKTVAIDGITVFDQITLSLPIRTIDDVKKYLIKYRTAGFTSRENVCKGKFDFAFDFLISNLSSDEGIICVLITSNFFDDCRESAMFNNDGVLIITNKKVAYCDAKANYDKHYSKIVGIDEAYSIQRTKTSYGFDAVLLKTKTESICFVPSTSIEINDIINLIDDAIKKIISQSKTVVVNNTSPMEELKKLKELLDANIITQEEFDLKKKQILGL